MTAAIGAAVLGSVGLAPVAAQGADPAYVQSGYDTDGQSVDSVAVFFEPLSHYGRWLDSRYGRVWSPNVARDWRPYTIGHWEDGPYGQTWRSDEPFGWAVFHFGRWAFDPAIGWVWSPDTVWGPGWVAWRDSDDVTGWAPLPPQINLFYGGGFGFNDWGYDQWYQPGWVYVPRPYLYARSLRGAYLPTARSRDFWDRTHGVTRYDRVDGQIVNHSFGSGGGRAADPRGFGQRRDGASPDLRAGQAYGTPRGGYSPPPPLAGARDGFSVAPGGFANRDGFVPGTPPSRGDRRSTPPTGAPAGRPQATFVAPPMARPTPPPTPTPRQTVPPRPREANRNERPR